MTLSLAIATDTYGLVAFDGGGPGVVSRIRDGVWLTGCGRYDVLSEIARQLAPCADPVLALPTVTAYLGAERLRRDPHAPEQVQKTTAFLTYRNGSGSL